MSHIAPSLSTNFKITLRISAGNHMAHWSYALDTCGISKLRPSLNTLIKTITFKMQRKNPTLHSHSMKTCEVLYTM